MRDPYTEELLREAVQLVLSCTASPTVVAESVIAASTRAARTIPIRLVQGRPHAALTRPGLQRTSSQGVGILPSFMRDAMAPYRVTRAASRRFKSLAGTAPAGLRS